MFSRTIQCDLVLRSEWFFTERKASLGDILLCKTKSVHLIWKHWCNGQHKNYFLKEHDFRSNTFGAEINRVSFAQGHGKLKLNLSLQGRNLPNLLVRAVLDEKSCGQPFVSWYEIESPEISRTNGTVSLWFQGKCTAGVPKISDISLEIMLTIALALSNTVISANEHQCSSMEIHNVQMDQRRQGFELQEVVW